MSASDSSNAARGPYLSWYLLSLQARYYFKSHKRYRRDAKKYENNLKASKKIEEKTSSHLQRTIREDPFAPYAQLQAKLNAMDIMIPWQTIIACLKSLGFESYFAAHKPR
ncbi:hypothetical protein CU098_004258 [Rhizopus stolonifer]|uniref:Uncharacterized protein n=1 Tax=Rhizopus stolonifer TaxID=4846 RepID=A0A367IXU8_RHIST|nr:hypothetical protein CU098_004258 [Rhizopus stolonifer]